MLRKSRCFQHIVGYSVKHLMELCKKQEHLLFPEFELSNPHKEEVSIGIYCIPSNHLQKVCMQVFRLCCTDECKDKHRKEELIIHCSDLSLSYVLLLFILPSNHGVKTI